MTGVSIKILAALTIESLLNWTIKTSPLQVIFVFSDFQS